MASELSHGSHVKDKMLFTPGPLSVSSSVRASMNRDLGSRDTEFIDIVRTIHHKLVEIAGFSSDTHACVIMQGSGTYAIEATLNTCSNRNQKVLILSSGAYGNRMGEICKKAGIPYEIISFPEDRPVELDENVCQLLATGSYTSLALVHCETTSGIFSNIEEIGQKLKTKHPSILYIVDAMSSFGGVEANFFNVDFLVSSANKCLQGVPGFAFVICKKTRLLQCQGQSTSHSLDLYDQWTTMERTGQFRFTPPTHCLLAFKKALEEFEEEGGVAGRTKRYKDCNQIIKKGMSELGFKRFVSDEFDGHIITSFKYPSHSNFTFEEFYDRLRNEGKLIYPGKVTNADCFRIGNIGHLSPSDMASLLESIRKVLKEMNVQM